MEEADQATDTNGSSETIGPKVNKQGGSSSMTPEEEVAFVENVLDEVAARLIEEISFKVMNEDSSITSSEHEMERNGSGDAEAETMEPLVKTRKLGVELPVTALPGTMETGERLGVDATLENVEQLGTDTVPSPDALSVVG